MFGICAQITASDSILDIKMWKIGRQPGSQPQVFRCSHLKSFDDYTYEIHTDERSHLLVLVTKFTLTKLYHSKCRPSIYNTILL